MRLQCRGRLIDGESILLHQDGMKNYSLIIEKEESFPCIDKHIPLSAAPPLSSVQEEGMPNQGNIIANLHLLSL